MNIIVPLLVLIVATIFYAISYISPKTDILLYGFSAFLFLVAGALGVAGFNDYPSLGGNVTVTQTDISSTETEYKISKKETLKNSQILNLLPITFILLSLYMFINVSITTRDN